MTIAVQLPVEERLLQLRRHLDIARAHGTAPFYRDRAERHSGHPATVASPILPHSAAFLEQLTLGQSGPTWSC